MFQRPADVTAKPPFASVAPPGITGVPLALRVDGDTISGKFLSAWGRPPGESRRDALARLGAWARSAAVAAAVVEDRGGPLYADVRALGFDDAGPLPRYAARVRPGPIRRLLTTVLLPGPRASPGVNIVAEALPDAAEFALRERLAPEFGALPLLPGELPRSGIHLTKGGQPVASCRFHLPAAGTGDLVVAHWIAPPGEPDLVARLALEALAVAARLGALAAVFETTHRELAKGLLLARFLPRRSRARVLVRAAGGGASAPSTADWHLTAPTGAGGCVGGRESV